VAFFIGGQELSAIGYQFSAEAVGRRSTENPGRLSPHVLVVQLHDHFYKGERHEQCYQSGSSDTIDSTGI
jgi:hypothetical protein